MNQIIIKTAICISYFMLGGLATTNILRLTKGNTLGVFSSKCFCANCNMRITPLNQLPIVSYIACKGHCRQCHTPLPKYALVLELLVFFGMSVISAVFHFRPYGVLVSFAYYEVIRIIFILHFGKRETQFVKQYLLALIAMAGHLAIVEFMALLLREVVLE